MKNNKAPASRENAQAGPSRRALPYEKRDPSGLPGVSKLKASIRQTKRLLAKENLEPGLRVQTQRRLTSLEADLAKAEKRQVESKNGERYHMVKFFERRKIERLIKRFKRQVDEATKPKQKARAERDLEEARVMLNYILHYSNEQKYIALFASNSATDEADGEGLSLPRLFPAKDQTETGTRDSSEKMRLDLLLRTRDMMRAGTLEAEPEVGLKDNKKHTTKDNKGRDRIVISEGTATTTKAAVAASKKAVMAGKSGQQREKDQVEDDFFEV